MIDQQQEEVHYYTYFIEIQPQSDDKSKSFVTLQISCFSTMVGGLNPENNQINNELTTTLSPNDSILSTNHILSRKTMQ